ncbi:MAG: ribonuclease P protein component [Clostridiales bacterium]|nr:ribonuclease P protein component [Clostridiales bacterium]
MLTTTQTLRWNYEFSRVYKRGKFATGRYLSVHCFRRSPNLKHNQTRIPIDIVRVGFTNGHGRRTAVARNRAKRLLRAAFSVYEPRVKTGYDIVFLMKATVDLPTYQEVEKELGRHLSKLDLLIDGE